MKSIHLEPPLTVRTSSTSRLAQFISLNPNIVCTFFGLNAGTERQTSKPSTPRARQWGHRSRAVSNARGLRVQRRRSNGNRRRTLGRFHVEVWILQLRFAALLRTLRGGESDYFKVYIFIVLEKMKNIEFCLFFFRYYLLVFFFSIEMNRNLRIRF